MKTLASRCKEFVFLFLKSTGVLRLILSLLAKLFRTVAVSGMGSDLCLKEGYLPVPVNYYSPIPDIYDLEKRDIWDKRSELRGIDFRTDEQKRLLRALGERFSKECQWPLERKEHSLEFYLQNPCFSYGCAASTHCMIRHAKPATVIEIGSGMSSRVIAKALAVNREETMSEGAHIIVDPYPDELVKKGSLGVKEVIERKVETLDLEFWQRLRSGDILFIDSGHCVRIGGDVNYLFLDVLPRLAPGVIVHIHDIALPREYPKAYATSETFRQFWTEQYLLQGFLCFNNEFEILLAMSYLMTDHQDLFRRAFPFYDPENHRLGSASFWMRRKLREDHR